jgi:hypothetical protein
MIELLSFLFQNTIIVVVIIATSIWVFFDANKIGAKGEGGSKKVAGMGPVEWFFACLLFWIIGFPLYLVKRAEQKKGIHGK